MIKVSCWIGDHTHTAPQAVSILSVCVCEWGGGGPGGVAHLFPSPLISRGANMKESRMTGGGAALCIHTHTRTHAHAHTQPEGHRAQPLYYRPVTSAFSGIITSMTQLSSSATR